MAEQRCGASIQACAERVAVLEQDGVPLPGSGNLYVTDALIKLEATPVYVKGTEIEQENACGSLCVNFKARDILKRYDLSLEFCSLDPELEQILVGGELFSSGGFTVGGSSPQVGVINNPFGVSLELWSKHIVNGDQDSVYPYIHWIIPRSYWQPGKNTWDNGNMSRLMDGYTTENPNFFNGPMGDWPYSSDRSIAWAYATSIPTPECGAQSTPAS